MTTSSVAVQGTVPQIAAMLRGIVSNLYPDKRGDELQRIIMMFATRIPEATGEVRANGADGPRINFSQMQVHHLEMMRALAEKPTCAHPGCEVQKNLQRCTRCRAFMYCGKPHQAAHWKEHKGLCTVIAEAAHQAKTHPECQIQ